MKISEYTREFKKYDPALTHKLYMDQNKYRKMRREIEMSGTFVSSKITKKSKCRSLRESATVHVEFSGEVSVKFPGAKVSHMTLKNSVNFPVSSEPDKDNALLTPNQHPTDFKNLDKSIKLQISTGSNLSNNKISSKSPNRSLTINTQLNAQTKAKSFIPVPHSTFNKHRSTFAYTTPESGDSVPLKSTITQHQGTVPTVTQSDAVIKANGMSWYRPLTPRRICSRDQGCQTDLSMIRMEDDSNFAMNSTCREIQQESGFSTFTSPKRPVVVTKHEVYKSPFAAYGSGDREMTTAGKRTFNVKSGCSSQIYETAARKARLLKKGQFEFQPTPRTTYVSRKKFLKPYTSIRFQHTN